MKHLKKAKDFLYKRKGPWPQPSPEHPFGEAPAVIHLPLRETLDWWLNIGTRYLLTLMYTPIAYAKGFIRPGLDKVSDEEFKKYLTESMMAKFIKKSFDQEDYKVFGDKINFEDYKIIDLEAVKVVKSFKGVYVSASKVLLKKSNETLIPELIYIDKTNSVFKPTDGDSWELAKYFVLQGAALSATLVIHPLLHFPLDSINAVTKTALPKSNTLFQLLYPHLRFTLYLENAVLTFKTSLLQSKWWMPYAPYPGPYQGLRELLVEGYMGIEDNPHYPPYVFPIECPEIYGKYGDYHKEYYPVFKDFVEKVLKDLKDEEWFYIYHWADYINSNVREFPNASQIKQSPHLLIDAVTSYLFTVTIGHTVDHYNYGRMNFRQVPLRIRHLPPKTDEKITLERNKLNRFWDYGKYDMAKRLFFRETTRTSLETTKYNFTKNKESRDLFVKEFKEELKRVDKKLKQEGKCFMPLKDVAASIQF